MLYPREDEDAAIAADLAALGIDDGGYHRSVAEVLDEQRYAWALDPNPWGCWRIACTECGRGATFAGLYHARPRNWRCADCTPPEISAPAPPPKTPSDGVQLGPGAGAETLGASAGAAPSTWNAPRVAEHPGGRQ